MNKIETRVCEECGEEVIMLIDKTGMLIKYERMCSCIERILQLRGQRADEFADKSKKKLIL